MSGGGGEGQAALDRQAAAAAQEKLAREKLELEIEELRAAPPRTGRAQRLTLYTTLLTAAISAATTLVIGYATYTLNIQAQRANAIAQADSDRQHQADTYAKLLENLGSSNVPARAGAVVGLKKFTDPNASPQAAQTVTILIAQLTSETDSRVLRILIPAIVDIGPPALDELARANRFARYHFVSDARNFIFSQMPSLSQIAMLNTGSKAFFTTSDNLSDERGEAFQAAAESIYFDRISPALRQSVDLDLLTETEQSELNSLISDRRIDYNIFTNRAPAHAGPFEILLFQLIAGPKDDLGEIGTLLKNIPLESKNAEPDRAELTSKSFVDNARVLFLTGLAISRMIGANSGKLGHRDLSGIFIASADLHGTNLAGATLQSAFIAGQASGINFKGANLSESDLRELSIDNSNLQYSDLSGTRFFPRYYSQNHSSSGRLSPPALDLTGANWWDMADLTQHDIGSIQGVGVDITQSPTSGSRALMTRCPTAPSDSMPASSRKPAHGSPEIRISLSFCASLDSELAEFLDKKFPAVKNIGLRIIWLKANPHQPTTVK